ncbi:hypothetical protein COCCADRAFT_39010 [Bipolaris zeicola 26-R-13]|uniref:Alpha/beta hydrolase fold-3 domain-containing protein n=1 Tax=Cochliobolus carbonum (strain 26-R-13) TaxID=930089 RepID=W6YHJ9_COCC2|nr:uncharacterized protein COCCADRAFT_39010 [Bipolaris zeicola 26-R-13]EUC30781.1 hypothetical protein COCCADRAFT_39010 [Bipolaris zeicola 26-R-13]
MRTSTFLVSRSPFIASPPPTTELFRVIIEELGTISAEPTDVTYEDVNCPRTVRPAIWCKPKEASASRVILNLHGGGFVTGSPSSHRKLAGHLAKTSGCHALVLDYERAPENRFPKQQEDVIAAYKCLMMDKKISSKNIVFAGDSAGRRLTISSTLMAKNLGLDLPAAIVTSSPWFDVTMDAESYDRGLTKQSFVTPEAIGLVAGAYVGNAPTSDPLIDLLHADFMGLPPIYITAGTEEIHEKEALQLTEHAKSAKVEVRLEIVKDMDHIWVMMAGRAPEADKTIAEAANFLRKKW